MNKLSIDENGKFFVNKRRKFEPIGEINKDQINSIFDFAYNMSFGGEGYHRSVRSGGAESRKNGQVFIDTFQGKIAEFGIYNYFKENGIDISQPDMDQYGRGEWDKYDFIIQDKKIAVKSTKYYGQLLLLEKEDWNESGEYIPNLGTDNSKYDYFILVRISPNGEAIMKSNKYFFCDNIEKNKLTEVIINNSWEYDIPGYITREELIKVINQKNIIEKSSQLGNVYMDATNYYVQAGDLHPIENIIEDFNKELK